MDLRELQYFCAVVELQSFSKASQSLRIAQSAISRQVQKLEARLGVELLVRSASGIEMTDAGRLLFERATTILRQVEETRNDILARSLSPVGELSIGVPPGAGALIVPPLLRQSKHMFPNVRLKIIEGMGEALTDRLKQSSVSIGLIYDPKPSRELLAEPLLVERVHVFGLPGSRCSQPGPMGIEDVVELPLIIHSRPHYIRTLLDDATAEAGLRLSVAYEVDSLSVIRSLVQQKEGYGVLTPAAAQGLPGDTKFVSKRIMTSGMSLTLCVVRRVEQKRSLISQEITKLIKDETRRLIETEVWPASPAYVGG
ncbi:LysR family transcriptional regulator [Microvirga antarctica]|uniref:LysR family transcriptional regulator n=1 Tax=Microvirga antarctica TaxID=2819233 RepID=UPI001B310BDF|nr:LysR family transcriptional regulator [Microvirga antarctica]